MNEKCHQAARRLKQQLHRTGHRIVFAESCTAGLVAATLGQIPGISAWLAGSAVVYQLQTKVEWLHVDPELLADPGPVSREVAEQMVTGVLNNTPHATIAASITGHLGPDAPADLDGTAWCAVSLRGPDLQPRATEMFHLTLPRTVSGSNMTLREHRRYVATACLLQLCEQRLSGQKDGAAVVDRSPAAD